MAKMRAVQVAKAGGPLELVEKEIPYRGWSRASEGARVRHLSQRCITIEGHWPGINIRACPGTRSQAWSMQWALACSAGNPVIA